MNLPKQQTAAIKPDDSFSTWHPSNTPAATHSEKVHSWASQFPSSALLQVSCPDPTVLGLDQNQAELSNTSILEIWPPKVTLFLYRDSKPNQTNPYSILKCQN